MDDEKFIKLSDLSKKTNNLSANNHYKIPLPYPKLNEVIKGIHKGDLVLLESRPSMGTTTLCINLTVLLAKQKYKVAYLSLDLPPAEIASRLENCLSHYSDNEIEKNKNINLNDLEIYISTKRRTSDWDILVDMQEMMDKYKIDLFILDYVQLIDPSADFLTNSDDDIKAYIQTFKHALRKLNTSLIVVSKLTNAVDENRLEPPGLKDCNIDWATDTVIVLDSLIHYGCQHDYDGNSTENRFYLMLYKNKYGKTTDTVGRIDYHCDFEKQTVSEL